MLRPFDLVVDPLCFWRDLIKILILIKRSIQCERRNMFVPLKLIVIMLLDFSDEPIEISSELEELTKVVRTEFHILNVILGSLDMIT